MKIWLLGGARLTGPKWRMSFSASRTNWPLPPITAIGKEKGFFIRCGFSYRVKGKGVQHQHSLVSGGGDMKRQLLPPLRDLLISVPSQWTRPCCGNSSGRVLSKTANYLKRTVGFPLPPAYHLSSAIWSVGSTVKIPFFSWKCHDKKEKPSLICAI